MVFKTSTELKNHLMSKINVAVEKAAKEVYEIIDDFLNIYYNEYIPSQYIRTSQYLHSLVKPEITRSGNTVKARVYFDIGSVRYDDDSFSDREIMWMNLMEGTHRDNMPSGTAVWNESMAIMDKEGFEMLKKALIDAGIPIK